jgi:DNA-binding transcriptional regulator YhcF (GntR family)
MVMSLKCKKNSNIPLYQQIAGRIAGDISSGKIKPSSPLPSINSLKSNLGVARNTVIEAMRQLVHDGYAVSKHGKGFYSVDRKMRPVMNMIVPLHHYYYIQVYVNLIAGAQDAAEHNGEWLAIHNSHEHHTDFKAALHEVASAIPNPRILAIPPVGENGLADPKSIKELEKLVKGGARVIVIDREVESNSFPQIIQDKLEGRKILLKRLFKTDCMTAVFIGAPEHRRELRTFADEYGWNGKLFFENTVSPEQNLKSVRENKYEVVFCPNDLHARRMVIAAGNDLDFRIAGYDGTVIATSISPRISTVNSNLTEAGEIALKIISEDSAINVKIKVKPFFMPGDTF